MLVVHMREYASIFQNSSSFDICHVVYHILHTTLQCKYLFQPLRCSLYCIVYFVLCIISFVCIYIEVLRFITCKLIYLCRILEQPAGICRQPLESCRLRMVAKIFRQSRWLAEKLAGNNCWSQES